MENPQLRADDARANDAPAQYGMPGGRDVVGSVYDRPDAVKSSPDNRAATTGRPWRLGPRTARDVMTRNPSSVGPTDTVRRVAQVMVDEDTGIVPVVEGARLLGVVTDRDLVCRALATGDVGAATARDVMTADVECVAEHDPLATVLEVMAQHQIRRVAVVTAGDRLVGIISLADLAREADVDLKFQRAFAEISATRHLWSCPR